MRIFFRILFLAGAMSITGWLLFGDRMVGLPASVTTPIGNQHAQEDWFRAYTNAADAYTSRTYDCITEMYSRKYDPVNSGPVCRDSCRLLDEVNALVDKSPVVGAEAYRVGQSEVCDSLRAKKRKEQP